MAEDFMEISKEDIENVENALKMNSDYKLKDSKFNVKTFEKAKDIVLIQYVANVENELVFNTYEENGRYYISRIFELSIFLFKSLSYSSCHLADFELLNITFKYVSLSTNS